MAFKRPRREFEADLQAQQSPHVLYGTPLPPLDPDARDDGSYVPVWKQEVVDERGRKRLHGAFTGGFSAGYFNTVGSKEGWTPSSFVSSRSDRNKHADKKAQQRPEDFMDEEDLADAAESQSLQTNDAYAALGSTSHDQKSRGFMMDLFRPTHETMGVKLLRKMGWRDGQGVGPKVRREAVLDELHSASRPGTEEHLFAPRNTSMIGFIRKNDTKGLGYTAETRLPTVEIGQSHDRNSDDDDDDHGPFAATSRSSVSKATPKKSGPQRGGIGMGILNDDGSDNEDPYEIGPRISYNRVIGGDKKTKKKAAPPPVSSKAANPLLKTKPVFRSKNILASRAGFRRCHDGRLPLEGFLLSLTIGADSASDASNKYAPPKIPDDWTSSMASSNSPNTQDSSPYKSTADVAKSSAHTAATRAAALGEAILPGKSVFDFLSPAARDRIASASGKSDLPAAHGEAIPGSNASPPLPHTDDPLPALDKQTAATALGRGIGGWMPYAEDTGKRSRYRAFLSWRAGLAPDPPTRPPAIPREQWAAEHREFAHAAEVFKPMTGMMAARFTSASTPNTPSQNPDAPADAAAAGTAKKKQDPAEEAARLGMFGPLTRSAEQWFPARLLCKRFNVRLPAHAEQGAADDDATGRAQGQGPEPQGATRGMDDVMAQLRREGAAPAATVSAQLRIEDAKPTQASAEEADAAVIDVSRNEALEKQRAGEEVFRAIFGSDEDDSD